MADKTTRRKFLKRGGAATVIGAATAVCLSCTNNAPAIPGDRNVERWEPKLAENLGNLEDDTLRWQAQMGHKWVVLQGSDWVDQGKKGYWTADDLSPLQQRCKSFGLRLNTIMIPLDWLRHGIFETPRRDQAIENTQRSIKAGAAAGIEIFEWRWKPIFKWGPEVGYYTETGRGGAELKAFDYNRVKDLPPFEDIGEFSRETLLKRMRYFMPPIIETAEAADVRLSLHPQDPPVKVLRGSERLMTNTDEIVAILNEFDSPAHGIGFCQGTITEMGVDVIEAIRRIGGMGKIHHVHFRGVRGKVPRYTETFIDEGDVDMLEAMRAFRDVGYSHTMVSDHTPNVIGDFSGGRIGRTFSHGYIRGMIQAVNAERRA